MSAPAKMTATYRFAMAISRLPIRWWGRLQVDGQEHLAAAGPVLLAGNHDSHWDPVAIGVAAMPQRQICALAKASMWKLPGLAQLLSGMGQIPIRRGTGDKEALRVAVDALRGGACIGIFPEGTLSRGGALRARAGIGRLAVEEPQARIVCCTVQGSVDLVRLPRRPRIRVSFFLPAGGGLQAGEDARSFAERLLAEIRERAPPVPAGRRAGARPQEGSPVSP